MPTTLMCSDDLVDSIGRFHERSSLLETLHTDNIADGLLATLRRNGEWSIVNSTEGPISEVFESGASEALDHSRSSLGLGFHKDGQYHPQLPPIVILHCVDAGDGSIPTTFIDTRTVLTRIAADGRAGEARDYNFVYIRRDGSHHRRPLVETHPYTGDAVINVSLDDRCYLEPAHARRSMTEAAAFYRYLGERAREVPLIAHHWTSGDTLLFDNVALAHGRGVPGMETRRGLGCRHLVRVWVKPQRRFASQSA
jgi:alpha-ketoglutarate-dependent taurine dioxygenase